MNTDYKVAFAFGIEWFDGVTGCAELHFRRPDHLPDNEELEHMRRTAFEEASKRRPGSIIKSVRLIGTEIYLNVVINEEEGENHD